jgi:2-polyprenyl-3-methyl-5-hydroxy-6-metoxy-1,4-benzoquinol methylase
MSIAVRNMPALIAGATQRTVRREVIVWSKEFFNESQQSPLGKRHFTRIAETMRESGEALVRGLGISPVLKVLDLGCGDGTTALPAARLGADVLGVDIASNLVEAGNKRAREEGLTNCKFQEGDASDLHEIKNHSFDLLVSIFGAMLLPSRLTRPRRWSASLGPEAGS